MRTAIAILSVVVTARAGAQQASFVYRLGKDTVAIDQYTRTANRLSGEMVQRTGASVILVRYEMALRPDGLPASASVRRMQPDGTPFPNQPTEVRFTVTTDSVVREFVRPDTVQRTAMAARQGTVVLPVYVYGAMELLAARRRSGGATDSLPSLSVAGPAGFVGLEGAGGDTLRMRGVGIYPMRFLFDSRGQLQLVDGAMTTNKVVAVRGPGGLDMAAIARAMRPTGTLSARDVARGGFGPGAIVLVDYGRPMVRGRTVWGGALVPFDSVWRAGANDATHLFVTRAMTFGSVTVPAGAYTLWIQHTRTGTNLIVSRKIGMWGTEYDPAQDVARIPMQLTPTPSPVEELTVTVRNQSGLGGVLEFAWGGSVAKAAFNLSLR
ncbi:hypothetical protein BAC2_02562 [uncultured bacterium]|nr:hypothetical protein BAC2_02562 [uncultured bacterium]